MSKFTLTLADGNTKTYSRKVDATRAGDKSGSPYRLVNPKGEVVVDGLELAPAPATKVDSKAIAASVDAAKSKRGGRNRTWTVSGPDATHKCEGACGETKPLKAYPTTKKNGQRGVECRKCRDGRTAI